ncbi:MAG: hypothetical protein ACLUBZ_00300 [Ruthenibacterium lactatiformans]|jgi:hypothetical protein|uniref:hypothetical protein n=1 Tax=Ruthenibacterium lactatiformans TaxID=1550024 RepID=UPI003996C4D5
MNADQITFTLSPHSPFVDCSWSKEMQASRKTITLEDFIRSIQESMLAQKVSSGLLPPGTISYCENSNRLITIAMVPSDEYATITYFNTLYENFPLPRMVFQFSFFVGQRVQSVRIGVIERGRVRPESRMFYYPFSNVHTGGDSRLCIGSNTLPRVTSPHGLSSLPRFLLELPNNDDWFNASCNKLGYSMRQLLEHLKGKTPTYYDANILVPNGKTLADFIAV